MNHWLLKTEPGTYSYADLVRDGGTFWNGIRNYQARNNLQAMRVGDLALIYHSVDPREIVGVARVTREAYPDPTVDDPRWVAVDIVPVGELREPVSLATIKSTPALAAMVLIRHTRLSVVPVTAAEFREVLRLGRGEHLA